MYRVVYRVMYRVMYRVNYRVMYRVVYRVMYCVMCRVMYRVMYRVRCTAEACWSTSTKEGTIFSEPPSTPTRESWRAVNGPNEAQGDA